MSRRPRPIFFTCLVCSLLVAAADPIRAAAGDAEADFRDPPAAARPYVWWHWMGPNFSKTGITRDLEAMKAAGIRGATIFNLTSAVQESHAPTLDNPWPEQTYRSPAYWDALRHAAAEAERLGLEIGLHNTVGYSTTGGPWIDEDRSMQRLVWSETTVAGGAGPAPITLPAPTIPQFSGWGKTGRVISRFHDVAVLAVPAGRSPVAKTDVVDLTSRLAADGRLVWDAPAGDWIVYRLAHASTGAAPHPVPDELIGRTLEVDKINPDRTTFHWRNVLEPLRAELGPALGRGLQHVLIDSYEAGPQNWTPGFRDEFKRRKGYDPLPWLVTLGEPVTGNARAARARAVESDELTARFEYDYRAVVADLYREHGWEPAREMIHAAGLTLQFEAYGGPFDTVAGSALADVPMVEFWTNGDGAVDDTVVAAARAAGRSTVGAEAFTGRPEVSKWTETPGFLRKSADGAFGAGVNHMILHHWVHQPFDDRHQPGMGMGWWGTHFGRHQTWAEPGREFFHYLARVQALLQRGETPVDVLCVGRLAAPGADVVAPHTFLAATRVEEGRLVLPSGRRYRLVVVPHGGALEPAMAKHIGTLLAAGANIVARRPARSPSLENFPACDAEVTGIAARLWSPTAAAGGEPGAPRGRLFADVSAALAALGIEPPARVLTPDADRVRIHARRDGDAALFFATLRDGEAGATTTVSFADSGRQPELWDAETGVIAPALRWRANGARTEVDLELGGGKSVFVVFRRSLADPAAPRATEVVADAPVRLAVDARGELRVHAAVGVRGEVRFDTGRGAAFALTPPAPVAVAGPWRVSLAPKVGEAREFVLPALASLSEHPDAEVRAFSGTATYRASFTLDEADLAEGRGIELALGEVRDLVRVRINGRDLGVWWHAPFQRDVTAGLKAGENALELAVTNTWHNRLVADERFPADFEWGADRGPARGRAIRAYPGWFLNNTPRPSAQRKAFVVWSYHRADTPLLPSGLLGPVRLVRTASQVVRP